jgi:NAD(P)-dependent dehydrogenase (short-subunit alcohol dehydrogenase family)
VTTSTSFSNTKSVIIGGGSGIGLALAQKIVQGGGKVVIASRSKERLQQSLQILGTSAIGFELDITQSDHLPAFFEKIGSFNHLVITSTQTVFKPFGELTSPEVLAMIQTKLLGSFFAAQAAMKKINPSGSITFFGGFAGEKATKNASVVALINSGLEGLTKSLALEISPLRVNLIAPGIVDTGRWDHFEAEEKQKAKIAAGLSVPARRVGETEDITSVAIMLLLNTFITGSILRVDGGAYL